MVWGRNAVIKSCQNTSPLIFILWYGAKMEVEYSRSDFVSVDIYVFFAGICKGSGSSACFRYVTVLTICLAGGVLLSQCRCGADGCSRAGGGVGGVASGGGGIVFIIVFSRALTVASYVACKGGLGLRDAEPVSGQHCCCAVRV